MAHRTAFFLVGPTAVGKTAVAHWIARQESFEILSADSMLVYKGMDIGTAKPDSIARSEVRYHGIDITSPDQSSSLAQWILTADEAFRVAKAPLIVTGGTGLYLRSLVEGFAEGPPPNFEKRSEWEALYDERGLVALQELLRSSHPKMYASLSDTGNPRRLIRSLELAAAGISTRPDQWDAQPSHTPFVGLSMNSSLLHSRIEARIRQMYREGLLEELAQLTDKYPMLSGTASQAIGYAEAMAVRNGDLMLEEAIEKGVIRTRKLAKRQRTWFNHQANVEWVPVESPNNVEEVCNRVRETWNTLGPTEIKWSGGRSSE